MAFLRAVDRFLCGNQRQVWKVIHLCVENEIPKRPLVNGMEWKSIAQIVSTTRLGSLESIALTGRSGWYHQQQSVLYRNNTISLLETLRSGYNQTLTSEMDVSRYWNNQTTAESRGKYKKNSRYWRWSLSWKEWLSSKWYFWKKVCSKSNTAGVQSLLLSSSIGLAAMIASDVEPKRTDTGEKVSYGPHSSALLNAAARHGAGSAPPHETGIGLIPGRILKLVGWSLAQLVGIGLIWLMVHHPSSSGVVALIGLLLFATNPSEASFLQWIKTQAPILARHKEAKIDKLRVRIAPYLFNLQVSILPIIGWSKRNVVFRTGRCGMSAFVR